MSKAARRFRRTILLGVLALGTLVYTAVDQFGVAPETLWQLALGSVIAALVVIGAAGLAVGLWLGLRRLWRGWRER